MYDSGVTELTGEMSDGGVVSDGVLGVTGVHSKVGVPHVSDPDTVVVSLLVPLVVGLVHRSAPDAVPLHLGRGRGG